MRVMLNEMTWQEAKEMISQEVVAIIPAGSNEQHGPHLWLQEDTALALTLARKAAEKIFPKAVVTPPIAIGFSPMHMNFPGSLTLGAETLMHLSLDIHRSLKRNGIRKIVTLNAHGGNQRPLHLAARIAHDELGLTTAYLDHWDVVPPEIAALCEDHIIPGHGGDYETSLALSLFPEGVRPAFIDKKYVERLEKVLPPYQRFLLRRGSEYSKSGAFMGDATLATREKGEKFAAATIDGLAMFLTYFHRYGDEVPEKIDPKELNFNPKSAFAEVPSGSSRP